ncbi:MAG: response regulator transcription factor [Chloroflexota bacterium]
MKKTNIIVIDDEISILRYVSACLRKEGYQVATANNSEEGLILTEEENPELIMLDIMMPNMDGFEVCRRLREWTQTPIIMLSALGDEGDKVRCLNLGADDYITKPFGTDELLARVRAVLRRTQAVGSDTAFPYFSHGDLGINFAQRRVTVAGKEIKLTPIEYQLLQEFALNAGKVLTYAYLLNKVWGPEYREEREYLHVFVGRLRAKLEPNPTKPIYIVTVPGVGYQCKG